MFHMKHVKYFCMFHVKHTTQAKKCFAQPVLAKENVSRETLVFYSGFFRIAA